MLSSRLPLLITLGLVVLTLAAYGQLWGNDFITMDDELFITQNPAVLGGLSLRGLEWAWETMQGGSRIPLTWMSLQLDASLATLLLGHSNTYRPLALVCHGQNLLWHTATVVLLFVVLRRMTGALWRSALVAALWAVHPLHVESVAWATERKDVLSTFFWVLTLLAYVRYVESPGLGRYLLVAASFVTGLLAKPMLVTLPFTLLLLDFWPLGRWTTAATAPSTSSFGQASPWRRLGGLVLEKLPLFVIAAAASVLVFLSQQQTGAVHGYSLSARLANAVQSYGWYLGKTLWPTGLAVFYCHPEDHWQWGPVLLAGVVLLALTVLALLRARQSPWLLVGWFWFVGTLLPVIGLVQVGGQARADRYVYVPHIGLLVALVWTASALARRLGLPGVVQVAAASGCLFLLSAATWVQVGHWRDTETIWNQALAVTTGNHRAHDGLAGVLFERALETDDPEMLERARQHFQKAVELFAGSPIYQNSLGSVLSRQGSLEEADSYFRQAILLDSQFSAPWHNLGVSRRQQRKYGEAIPSLRRALELGPQAGTYAELGLCLWHLHRHEEAEKPLQTALRLSPNEPAARYGLGLVLLRHGHLHDALQQFKASANAPWLRSQAWSEGGVALARLGEWEQAQRFQARALELEQQLRKGSDGDPLELSCFHRRRAVALRALGRDMQARQEYAQSLRLDPSWPATNLAQAWRLATAADPEERDLETARELAEQVCQALERPSAEALDVLAAAQAALGRYPEAARTAHQALARATPEQAQAIRARIQLYDMGLPFVARPGPN